MSWAVMAEWRSSISNLDVMKRSVNDIEYTSIPPKLQRYCLISAHVTDEHVCHITWMWRTSSPSPSLLSPLPSPLPSLALPPSLHLPYSPLLCLPLLSPLFPPLLPLPLPSPPLPSSPSLSSPPLPSLTLSSPPLPSPPLPPLPSPPLPSLTLSSPPLPSPPLPPLPSPPLSSPPLPSLTLSSPPLPSPPLPPLPSPPLPSPPLLSLLCPPLLYPPLPSSQCTFLCARAVHVDKGRDGRQNCFFIGTAYTRGRGTSIRSPEQHTCTQLRTQRTILGAVNFRMVVQNGT